MEDQQDSAESTIASPVDVSCADVDADAEPVSVHSRDLHQLIAANALNVMDSTCSITEAYELSASGDPLAKDIPNASNEAEAMKQAELLKVASGLAKIIGNVRGLLENAD